MTPLNSQDELSGPITVRRHRFLIALVAVAIISVFIFPMSWQLLVVVAYNGPDWMAAIAPQWHSTRSEPSMVVLGAMGAVILAYVHRPIRE